MSIDRIEFEGNWEDIQRSHATELSGRRVRVIVVGDVQGSSSGSAAAAAKDEKTRRFIEEFAGSWQGNDVEELLAEVKSLRSASEA